MSPRLADPSLLPSRAFVAGWWFFVVAAAIGFGLRLQVLHPVIPLEYGHLLHAHSHAAFLGWVYNAFFGLALHRLLPPARQRKFVPLFFVTQVATLGMLLTFPFQGYARESIAFSTLHMLCASLFAWWLLRGHTAAPAARPALLWALAFMLLSGLGPLALGPMAVLQLKGSPWYSFAIYFYLHFQYNGWFLFFLLALGLQQAGLRGLPVRSGAARRGTHLAAIGCVLTLAHSALWMEPPPWVFGVAVLGALLQLAGAVLLATAAPFGRLLEQRAAGWLAGLAVAAVAAKLALQVLGGWPALAVFATQRPVIIAFLHLIFLLAVTPMLLAWAVELGWLRIQGLATAGLLLLLAGSLGSQAVLFAFPLPALIPGFGGLSHQAELLAGASLLMVLGVLCLAAGLRPRAVLPPAAPSR